MGPENKVLPTAVIILAHSNAPSVSIDLYFVDSTRALSHPDEPQDRKFNFPEPQHFKTLPSSRQQQSARRLFPIFVIPKRFSRNEEGQDTQVKGGSMNTKVRMSSITINQSKTKETDHRSQAPDQPFIMLKEPQTRYQSSW